MKMNGETQIIGFFGSTYKESKMYAMYNAAFQSLNLNYIYIPFNVANLQKAVEGIRHLGVKAIGISVPYKIDIIQYIDELRDNAKVIGAVNGVVNENGKLIGHNTDGVGALKAIKEKTEVRGKNIVILGAGGAARAIAFTLFEEGGKLTILNRTKEKAQKLSKEISSSIQYGDVSDTNTILKNTDILINATSYGMINTDSEGQSLISYKDLRAEMVVMDIITTPMETQLLKDAKAQKCGVVYGYRMLLWQAVEKFKYYTGVEPPLNVMEEAMERMK